MIPDHPDWKAVIAGLLFQMSYWFNWERTGGTDGLQCAAVWKQVYNSIDWGDMSCCCEPIAISVRVNSITGRVEQSNDGGLTWGAQPGGLPSVIVNPVPAITSGVAANTCDAAANVRGQVDVWIAQVTTDFDTAISLLEFAIGVFEAILTAVLTILSLGALTPLEALVLPTIGVACAAAYAAGKAAFVDYWTSDVLDLVFCAAVCNIGDDGAFTDAQFSSFWSQVNVDLDPSPAKMLFLGFLSSVGKEGLSSMAASGLSSGTDCADCECSDFARIYVSTGGGSETLWDGEWLYASPVHDGSHYTLYVQTTNPDDTFDVDNCGTYELEVLTGTVSVSDSAYIPCGGGSSTPIGVTDLADICTCQLALRNLEDVPFTVRLRAVSCV
jgi:hypothetical protein